MRVVVDITGENGKTFSVTLVSPLAFVSNGSWICPPGYLLVFSGIFRFISDDISLYAYDPGYLLGDVGTADMQARLKDFRPKKGVSGNALIYDEGPLFKQVTFQAKWTVREAVGGTMKVGYGLWEREVKVDLE
jgi:hypothetical protein